MLTLDVSKLAFMAEALRGHFFAHQCKHLDKRSTWSVRLLTLEPGDQPAEEQEMNDQSALIAPAIDSLWQDFDGSPWPARYPPVRVLDVRDGWVRFAATNIKDSDLRLSIATFVGAYRPVEAQS
jgi:hypothetical protein